MLDYLPYMYEHQYMLFSGKPKQIASYETIIYPFDIYVWYFTFSLIVAKFLALLTIQNVWSYASEKPNPRDYIFQGF